MLPCIPREAARNNFNGQKTYQKRKLLDNLSRYEIRKHCGMEPEHVRGLFDILEPLMEPLSSSNKAVTAETQVLILLSFLRSGSFQYVESTVCGVSQPTISRILNKFSTKVIRDLAPDLLSFSSSPVALTRSKCKFHDIAGVPLTVGVIDGTHVTLKAPSKNESAYVNRKGVHSINTQVVCDYDYSFKDVVAKYPGSNHDAYIWRFCGLKQRFENGQFGDSWLLGDAGYGLEPCLLTPIAGPQQDCEKNYNRGFIKTRTLVERAIGVWKSRFRAMDRSGGALCYEPGKVCRFIFTSAVIHNYFVKNRIALLDEDKTYLENMIHDEMISPEGIVDTDSGVFTRRSLIQNYFTEY